MSRNLDSVLKTRGSLGKPRHHIKKQRHYFATKSPYSQRYGFTSSHVWMRELDHKEGWAPKNWCFHTMVLKDSWEDSCPRDSKMIKPVSPKGNQPWIFIGRTDAEVEAPIFWLPDAKSWLFGKDPGKGLWEKLTRGEEDDRGWDGWMTSLTQWTCAWTNSGR